MKSLICFLQCEWSQRNGVGRVNPDDVSCSDEVNLLCKTDREPEVKGHGMRIRTVCLESPAAAVVTCHSQINTPDGTRRGHDLFNQGVYVFLCSRDNNLFHMTLTFLSEQTSTMSRSYKVHLKDYFLHIYHLSKYDLPE